MDFWNKAKTLATDASLKSQQLSKEAALKSQQLTSSAFSAVNTARFADIVSETTKKSKELAADIKSEAVKRADQVKSLSIIDNALGSVSSGKRGDSVSVSPDELREFGVTEELREFVQSIDFTTFRDFPLPDDAEVSDVPTVSNVRQDLTKWQARHATLMLSTVKEISKLRYELCPRVMKERMFWRIYFLLVNSHVTPYEKRYIEQEKLKAAAAEQEKANREKEVAKSVEMSKLDGAEPAKPLQKASSSAEQDLDVFLLGDLADSDGGPDEGDDGFDDDFAKIDESSEDEGEKKSKP